MVSSGSRTKAIFMLLSRERANCAAPASVPEPRSGVGSHHGLRKRLLFESRFHVLQLDRGGEQGQPRYHAVRVKAVGCTVGIAVQVWKRAAVLESERLEAHARCVEVLVDVALGVHAIEAADHKVID